MNREMHRLRADFEKQASTYPDLRLSVFYVDSPAPVDQTHFSHPNHVVLLWQFIGESKDVDPRSMRSGAFGVENAAVSAFAVLEGSDIGLFLRMAQRAGSMVPPSASVQLAEHVMMRVPEVARAEKPFLSHNSNGVAVWLNLLLAAVSTFQPERFRGHVLTVDPFTGSLAAFDHLLLPANPPVSLGGTTDLSERRFDVAVSFPGERRTYVEAVVRALQASGYEVFYDKDFEAELARPDLDLLLQRIYRYNSGLVAVFLCQEYQQKEWCGLEWRAVRDLIKRRFGASVMPLRFDDTEIDGLFSIDGYVDLRRLPPEKAAELIGRRAGPA